MREYQVRICEGLGVKLPGPTRRRLFQTARAAIVAAYEDILRGGEQSPTFRAQDIVTRDGIDGAISGMTISKHAQTIGTLENFLNVSLDGKLFMRGVNPP